MDRKPIGLATVQSPDSGPISSWNAVDMTAWSVNTAATHPAHDQRRDRNRPVGNRNRSRNKGSRSPTHQ